MAPIDNKPILIEDPSLEPVCPVLAADLAGALASSSLMDAPAFALAQKLIEDHSANADRPTIILEP